MASEYLPFAFEPGAHVVQQAAWDGHADRRQGFRTGIADSLSFNKVWRQASVMTAALAEFIDQRVPGNVLDNGNVATLVTQLGQALEAHVGGRFQEAPHNDRWYARRNSGWHDLENMRLNGGNW